MNDELKSACQAHRQLALERPVNIGVIRQARTDPWALAPYMFQYGKFRISIMYETYVKPPRWTAQVSILEEVGELEFGAAPEALLAVQSWSIEDYRDARDIIGEALSPLIPPTTNPRHIHAGLWSLHGFADAPGRADVQPDDGTIRVYH